MQKGIYSIFEGEVATSHAPGQISAWECKDRYITVNGLFLSEK